MLFLPACHVAPALAPPQVEVAYADLAKDPTGTIGKIYSTLGLEGFESRVKPLVEAETQRAAVKGHKVNRFAPMPQELKRIVAKEWEAFSKAWGYQWS